MTWRSEPIIWTRDRSPMSRMVTEVRRDGRRDGSTFNGKEKYVAGVEGGNKEIRKL